ncbi:FAD-dependent oxidoreductase [Clostridium sp. MSJ-11]|uniref:FAD-dependent oxidoreductase n=1 Tax=Clostridium mobile TaxID=2841512 RepID=A0ABS6EFD5_9CLOT|nr:NAD(P)/FAD-dependent oxidoreductase [Clostridium mobile]MBU5483914.1 FAD-dependent oxidoreductase [Clostridium mobile]
MKEYDVIIIGGGIAGTSIARELSKYNVSVALLEAYSDLGIGTTKGNGGVVHAGYDPKPNTLKGKLNVNGSLMYEKLSKELSFKYKNTGSLVVGFEDKDLDYLKKLYENGVKNSVPNIEILKTDKIKEIEPSISNNAKFALYAPTAGIVEPFEVALAFGENALENGVDIFLNEKVLSIEKEKNYFYLETEKFKYKSSYVINAAGVFADEISQMVNLKNYSIKPRLGEILILDKNHNTGLNTVLFPIPSAHTKGIVVIPSITGNIIVGSTARMVDDKEDLSNTTEGINELLNGARKMVPQINRKMIIREFSGLRAVALENNDDFYIEASSEVKGFIHVAGIQSPGVASAPAIAEYVRDILSNEGLDLKFKSNFNPYRNGIIHFSDLSMEEREKLIKDNPSYGNVICRCETITEGEILQSINRPLGAKTLDGVKRRTRAGMGRCQSGFCQHRVLNILSKELHLLENEIYLENKSSNVILNRLKG